MILRLNDNVVSSVLHRFLKMLIYFLESAAINVDTGLIKRAVRDAIENGNSRSNRNRQDTCYAKHTQ